MLDFVQVSVEFCHVQCVKTAGCVAFTFQGMEDEGDPNAIGHCYTKYSTQGRRIANPKLNLISLRVVSNPPPSDRSDLDTCVMFRAHNATGSMVL
ncbi:hypothetical protein AAMO2058_001033200 [Amorphochlora amoebiformis]